MALPDHVPLGGSLSERLPTHVGGTLPGWSRNQEPMVLPGGRHEYCACKELGPFRGLVSVGPTDGHSVPAMLPSQTMTSLDVVLIQLPPWGLDNSSDRSYGS